MLRQELLALIEASGLPAGLRAALARIAAAGSSSLVKTALRRDPAGYLRRLARLVDEAAATLGLAPAEVCFATGFNQNDLAPERFDAMLAELEAALWLAGRGYREIRLHSQGAARGADLSARFGGGSYFFEVRRLRPSYDAPCKDYIKEKVEKKMRQVRTSCKKTGALCGGVLLVSGDPITIKVTGYLIQNGKLVEI